MPVCVRQFPLLLLAGAMAAGCGQDKTRPNPDPGQRGGSALKEKYLLAKEPAGARGVLAVRKDVKDGDAVVVVGRVGGSPKPMVQGRAAFTIVDPSLVPCNEKEGDTCATPWDYCCDTKEDLARATALVKFVDDQGKTLPHDAQEALGIKPLHTVVVRGRAKRDQGGNLTVLAEGLYVKPPGGKKP
jgi:hypothetical protein